MKSIAGGLEDRGLQEKTNAASTCKHPFGIYCRLMRIWSIHPKYLDTKGLVALWREALLAKHVLMGATAGYRNHPQLDRFKAMVTPADAINQYLAAVYEEACSRGYAFDREKIDWHFRPGKMIVTRGQIRYEVAHLLGKLKVRDQARCEVLERLRRIKPHPMFVIVRGEVEGWEKI